MPLAALISMLGSCSSEQDAGLPAPFSSNGAQASSAGPGTDAAGPSASAAGSDSESSAGGAAALSSSGESPAAAAGTSLGGAPMAGSETETDAGSAGEATEVESVAEPGVRFVGRVVEEAPGTATFAWSGTGIVAAFEGTSVSVSLQDGGSNEFTVVLDGQQLPKLVAQAGTQSYPLAADLAPGQHVVELYRRTEALFGATTFRGFEFGDGGTLLGLPAVTRRIEIVGDSISCGYGNEGLSATCGFTADTENHYATYGAIAARALDAEVVTIAWSGKGVVYNYDTDTVEPLPELYDRILPADPSSTWSFDVAPDAVVINLGTNDFSTDDDPSLELFRDEYVALLTHLREVYPDAYILCTVGPLLSGADLTAARAGIDAAVAERQASGDTQVVSWQLNVPNDNPGCDYHPGLSTHQAMGEALTAELRARLGW